MLMKNIVKLIQYMDWIYLIGGYIDREKISQQSSLTIWTSFIGQFIFPVGGEGMG